jgi:hypothetical protein
MPPYHWHCIVVPGGGREFAGTDEIREAFIEAFMAAGEPPDMGVFFRRDPEHEDVTIYFAPQAATLASDFHATCCAKPTPDRGLSLLAGDRDCWSLHFRSPSRPASLPAAT